MSAQSLQDARPLHTSVAERSHLMKLLSHHHEGRLGYSGGRGPRAVVVSYGLNAAGDIIIRVPEYQELDRYADGECVSFEVVDLHHPTRQETVMVHGTARVRADDHDIAGLPEDWPDYVHTRVLVVPIDELECLLVEQGTG